MYVSAVSRKIEIQFITKEGKTNNSIGLLKTSALHFPRALGEASRREARPGAPRALHTPGTRSLVATATPGTRLPPPRHAVTRSRVAPPAAALRRRRLAVRAGLTILTPSAEPIGGRRQDSLTRVTRCRAAARTNRCTAKAGRRQGGPMTARGTGRALRAPPLGQKK